MVRNGILATIGLLALYTITMTTLSGWRSAWEQFQELWYLMLPLAVGFGIQVGLYTKLKKNMASVAAGGTSASAGMLACCAHHATDVMPILGLSAASTLITQYQKPILVTSLLINVVGIGVLWKHVQK